MVGTAHTRSEKGHKGPHESARGRRVISSFKRWLHGPETLPPQLEVRPESPSSPEWQIHTGYSDADRNLFQQFPDHSSGPEPGFIVSYLGVRTRTAYATAFQRYDGQVFGVPLPLSDGFCAESIEYIGMLKSVLTAKERFTVLEFGAGWGPWLVYSAAAARHRGITDIRLHGIEADPHHFEFMQTHFRDNGLDPAAHHLDNAAVGVEAGWARWPKLPNPAADWGARPLEASTSEDGAAKAGGQDYIGRDFEEHIDVKFLPIRTILEREPVWDLLHIDVQGTETEVCTAAADLLDQRVRWMVIGTHSRKIEGDLFEHFFRHGWVLENEKTALVNFDPQAQTLEAMTYCDGTQVWKNPRF